MRKAQKSSASGSAKPPTTPCCSKVGLKRGPWTKEEDEILSCFVASEGEGRWRTLPKRAGLLRCGKSCRLRWMNYLRPSIKHGQIAPDEEDLIIRLHRLLGNRWSLIAGRIPGRTDNEIKNYWNTHLSKKLISQGINPRTHKPLNSSSNPNPREKVPPATPPNITITSIPNYTYSNPSSGTSYIPPAGVNFDHNNIYDHREFLGGAELSRGTSGIDNFIDDVFTSFCDSLINVDMFMQQEQQHLSQGGSGNHDSNTNQRDLALPFASGYEIGSIWSTPLSPVVGLDGDIDAQFMDLAGK